MVDAKQRSANKQPGQKVFGITPARYPYTGAEHVRELLTSAGPPQLELREDPRTNTTEIVIRFRGTSKELPESVREVYFRHGMTLAKAFQEVLRTVLQQKTLRAELAGVGYNAYRETWLHLVRMLYLDCFDDTTNKWLRQEDIKPLEKATSRRRGKESAIDRSSRLKRFQELLAIARRVHDAAEQAVSDYKLQDRETPATDRSAQLRKGIWERVKDFYGTRAAYLIFSGAAFLKISEGEGRYTSGVHRYLVHLERPNDWSAEELATAILAIEEDKSYKMTRRTIRSLSRKPGATPQ